MNIRENYGEFLTGKRIEKGLTIKQLSIKTGIPERNMLAVETEKIKNFSLHNITEICKSLGINLGDVVYD
jgi:DNA-binding Xre family transcriptional regulator